MNYWPQTFRSDGHLLRDRNKIHQWRIRCNSAVMLIVRQNSTWFFYIFTVNNKRLKAIRIYMCNPRTMTWGKVPQVDTFVADCDMEKKIPLGQLRTVTQISDFSSHVKDIGFLSIHFVDYYFVKVINSTTFAQTWKNASCYLFLDMIRFFFDLQCVTTTEVLVLIITSLTSL